MLNQLFGDKAAVPEVFISSVSKYSNTQIEDDEEESDIPIWKPSGDQPIGDNILNLNGSLVASISRDEYVYSSNGKETKVNKPTSSAKPLENPLPKPLENPLETPDNIDDFLGN